MSKAYNFDGSKAIDFKDEEHAYILRGIAIGLPSVVEAMLTIELFYKLTEMEDE